MCRYQLSTYRSSLACFTCRVVWGGPRNVAAAETGTTRCGSCGGDLVDMGRDFQAPRRRDKQAWSVLARIVDEVGPRPFDSCGCRCGLSFPRRSSELRALAARAARDGVPLSRYLRERSDTLDRTERDRARARRTGRGRLPALSERT